MPSSHKIPNHAHHLLLEPHQFEPTKGALFIYQSTESKIKLEPIVLFKYVLKGIMVVIQSNFNLRLASMVIS